MPRFTESAKPPIAGVERSPEEQEAFGFGSTAFWGSANSNLAMLVASAMALLPLNVTERLIHKFAFRYACLIAVVMAWGICFYELSCGRSLSLAQLFVVK